MFYTIKVVDQNNIIKFQSEFDRQRQVDIEKLREEYQRKYPKDKIEVK